MQSTRLLLFASVVSMLLLGCKSEGVGVAPTANSSATPGIAVTQSNKSSTIDDAALVLANCDRPSSDRILPIYDKMNNGPVRRIVYRRKRAVTIEFVPSHPILKDTYDPASPHRRRLKLLPKLPLDSVWLFDEASIPHEENVITAHGLTYFLPCAATALHAGY